MRPSRDVGDTVDSEGPSEDFLTEVIGNAPLGMCLIIQHDADVFIYTEGDKVHIETFSKLRDRKPSQAVSKEIISALNPDGGFLDNHLNKAIEMYNRGKDPFKDPRLGEEGQSCVRAIVEGYQGEKGRALYVHSVLVSSIKAVRPEQDIRLHKSRWVDGINMRTIDKKCVTAWFNSRKMGVKLNTDGVFMTRTLADNYPYVPLFQADMKGPKDEWLCLIDGLQRRKIDPSAALRALLLGALQRYVDFSEMGQRSRKLLSDDYSINEAHHLISKHISSRSSGGARLLELAIHTWMQCAYEAGLPIPWLGGPRSPAPIKPMRSPDKKAGHIGDIQFPHAEFEDVKGKRFIEYAIDAKHDISTVGPEIERMLTHIEDIDTPQVHLKRIDLVSLFEAPEKSYEKRFEIALEELQSRGIEVHLSSLKELLLEIGGAENLGTAWVRRYMSTLAGEDHGYGSVTEITTDWLSDLEKLLG